jgi:hypothetical protein
MNGQYYVDLIIQMRQAIIEKSSKCDKPLLRNTGANLADEFSYYKTMRRFTQLKLQSVLYEIWASKKLTIHPTVQI